KDGVYESEVYGGSGSAVTQIILEGFLPHIARIESGVAMETYENALARARRGQFDYLVVPTILAWEDRNTVWSSIPDRAEIKIQIVDVKTGDTLDATVIRGKGATVTL